jgi:hypothetical protein
VDIPLPKNIGEHVEIQSDFLSLNVPFAKISKMKPLSEGLNITALDGTRSVIPVLQNKRLPILKEYIEQCGRRKSQNQQRVTIVQEEVSDQNQKKKNTKSIRGKRKTN